MTVIKKDTENDTYLVIYEESGNEKTITCGTLIAALDIADKIDRENNVIPDEPNNDFQESITEIEPTTKLRCAHCDSEYMTERAALSYHNHDPDGEYVDEIYECDDCGEYTQAMWRIETVRKLSRIVVT